MVDVLFDTANVRQRIRRELPSETFRPVRARALVALGLAGVIAALSGILAAVPLPWYAALPLATVCGALYGSLFFLGHDIGHGSVVRSKAWQFALMWLAFSIFLLSPTLWRVWHNKVHHRHTNRAEYDPDNFGWPADYFASRPVQVIAALTPGSGTWLSLLYLPTWFTAHSQIVLWRQSYHCRGFESLNRRRAVAETAAMAAFWLALGFLLGPAAAAWVIVIPMLVANAIIMSYIVTNHLLRPLVAEDDQLGTSMSVTTHPWLDRLHFNFSHHTEHHLFPAVSSKHYPLVRAKLHRYAGERYLAPPHWQALRMVFNTPRIHALPDVLVDPPSGRVATVAEVTKALCTAPPRARSHFMSLKQELDSIFKQIPNAAFAVRYWDGNKVTYGTGKPEFVLHLNDRAAAKHMMADPLARLPEAYAAGTVEVDGNLQRLLRLSYVVDPRVIRVGPWRKLMHVLSALRERNSLGRARANVSHHYDQGNSFYRLWLDRDMVYSCAYFQDRDDDLESAQRQKLEHICRKLALKPGQRLLDIGCGWGALAGHAAREFGAEVLGITLSHEQHALCQERIKQNGLDGRVQVRLQDYRQLESERFDAVASVGMMEHVGEAYLPAYMQAVARVLRPGGTGMFQLISQTHNGAVTPWIARHIFPGMYLAPLGELATEMPKAGLRIVDVENLRPHYAMTLDRWIDRFEKNVATITQMFGETLVRRWRMYLNASSAAFKHGELNLWQITFTHGFSDDVPLTRRHLYAEPAVPALAQRVA